MGAIIMVFLVIFMLFLIKCNDGVGEYKSYITSKNCPKVRQYIYVGD